MAYTLSNNCAKNLCKRTVLLQFIIKNVVTCFFGTQCSYAATCRNISYDVVFSFALLGGTRLFIQNLQLHELSVVS